MGKVPCLVIQVGTIILSDWKLALKKKHFGALSGHLGKLIFISSDFYWKFQPEGEILSKKVAERAHITIFQTFRICINFYNILKIEPAGPDLPPKTLEEFGGKISGFYAIFHALKTDNFCSMPNVDQK